jgi:aminoglycoside/choline kinase family phosphotransferase
MPERLADLGDDDKDALERIADAQEQQAEAMELIAGMMMVRFSYDEDMPEFNTEALRREAEHFADGGSQ